VKTLLDRKKKYSSSLFFLFTSPRLFTFVYVVT
jgi:hypothetical protein